MLQRAANLRSVFSVYRLPASSLAVLVAAFLAFGAVIPGEFVVDDKLWAVPRPSFAEDTGASIALQKIGTWVFRPLHGAFVNSALMLIGPSAPALHCLSIALHAANGVLLFLLLKRLLPQLALPPRLAMTLLFVVHPAGSEAVLWISAMSELTVLSVMLATLLLYLRWRQAWSAPRIAMIAGLFLVGYLFKETAIMLPFMVVAYEWAQDRSERKMPRSLIGCVLVAPVLFLIIRYAMLGSLAGGLQLSINPLRVMELGLAHLRFIWLPAAPPFALRPPEVALASPLTVALALAMVAVAALLGWRLKANRGALWLGLAWIAVALWPAYAVAMVGEGFFNGRQAYIASAGLPIILGALLARLSVQQARAALALICVTLAWMIYATASNAFVWRSNLEVYRQAMAVSASADGPRAGIASALLERGDSAGAVVMYAEALARAKTLQARSEYLYDLARILGQSGRHAESERHLRELIGLEPKNSFAWVGLGNNAWSGGRIDEAAGYYRRAIELNPGNFEAVSNLANMLAASGPAYAAEAAKWRSRLREMAMHRNPPRLR